MRYAVDAKDELEMEMAFGDMKSHYKFIGIMTITIISIYILMFIVGIGYMANL